MSGKDLTLKLGLWIALSLGFLSAASTIYAGTDLTVTCQNQGPCQVSPASTPLFNEQNRAPGQTSTQQMTITNQDSDDTCHLVLNTQPQTPPQPFTLSDRLFAAITDGSTPLVGTVVGNEATSVTTYSDLFNQTNTSLGAVAPGSSKVLTWYATFDITAGNEYQNKQMVFDMTINIDCTHQEPTPGPSSGTGSGGGGSTGGTTTVSASPQLARTFLSGVVNSVAQRVLGAETAIFDEVLLSTPSATSEEGTTPVTCTEALNYWPLILLILQIVVLIVLYVLFGRAYRVVTFVVAVLVTVTSILLYNWLAQCDCLTQSNWLTWLCQWFIWISIIVSLVITLGSYVFGTNKPQPEPEVTKRPVRRRRK